MQTGLPLAAISATGDALGASGLNDQERKVLWELYLPWAVRVGSQMKDNALMCTYYEEELETDLNVLRERMGIEAFQSLSCRCKYVVATTYIIKT